MLAKVLHEWRHFFLPAAAEHVLPLFLATDDSDSDASFQTALAAAARHMPASALKANMLPGLAAHFSSINTVCSRINYCFSAAYSFLIAHFFFCSFFQ